MYFKLPNIKVVVSFVRLVCLIMCIFLSNVCMKINRDTHTCARCNTRFSAYFCSICKLFTGEDKHPYHCTKCGICRLVDTLCTECRKMKCSFLRACDNKKSDLPQDSNIWPPGYRLGALSTELQGDSWRARPCIAIMYNVLLIHAT